MTLIASKKKPVYRFYAGDIIGAKEAAELLGYKSPRNLQDANRRRHLAKEFEAFGVSLTVDRIGGELRFLRSEIDKFLSKKFEAVEAGNDTAKLPRFYSPDYGVKAKVQSNKTENLDDLELDEDADDFNEDEIDENELGETSQG